MNILIILFSTMLWAQDTNLECIKLEGRSLGCFPATDHPCFGRYENAEEEGVGEETRNCNYYKDLNAHLENVNHGPIAFDCRTWKQTSLCANPEFTGYCSPDDCEDPYDPTCKQQCKTCVLDKYTVPIQVPQIGCFIGSDGSSGSVPPCRQRCDDEPYWKGLEHNRCLSLGANASGQINKSVNINSEEFVACMRNAPDCSQVQLPPDKLDYIAYDGGLNKCNSIDPCPQFVRRTGGGWEETAPGTPGARPVVITGPSSCTPVDPGPPGAPSTGRSCPWMKEFGANRRDCEPIPDCCKWPPIANYATACPNGCVVDILPESTSGNKNQTPKKKVDSKTKPVKPKK